MSEESATLTVWGRPSSFNVQKVLWALEEAAVPFRLRFASAIAGPGDTPGHHDKPANPETQTEEYLKMNPTGLVPTLVVQSEGADSVAIPESNTIVRYVARRFGFGTRRPQDAEVAPEMQALREAWMDRQGSENDWGPVPAMIEETSRKKADDRSPERLRQAMRDFAKGKIVQVAEKQLASAAFLAGDEFSIADIPLGAVACRYFVAKETSEKMGAWASVEEPERPEATPALDAWFERLLARDAFRRGVYDPERIHAGLSPTRPLPAWHSQYLEDNGLDIPPHS